MGIAEDIAALLHRRKIAVLSGAGISTESGIPDYRGPETRRRARTPVQFQQFLRDPSHRQRYWARSTVGWPRFRSAEPNLAHKALAQLERHGALSGIITQNVDRLHQKAGSRKVVELHGALAEVQCLDCQAISDRDELQARLEVSNSNWRERTPLLAPDGDADVSDEGLQDFVVPVCTSCGGTLKPNVVFFGESVPKSVVDAAWDTFNKGEVLLVLGSSLAIHSGYRFLRRASEEKKPIVIINIGTCRGQEHATYHWDSSLGDALPMLSELLQKEH